jgi:hypothetical protein
VVAQEDLGLLHILPAAPERLFVDLGPIVVRADHAARWRTALLSRAARLGADAVIERGAGVSNAYLKEFERAAALSPQQNDTSMSTGLWVLAAFVGSAPMERDVEWRVGEVSQVREYRALKYVDALPPALGLGAVSLSEELTNAFAAATDVQEQLSLALTYLLSGQLDPPSYERLREHLSRGI